MEQLFDLAELRGRSVRLPRGLDYRVIGGLAAYLYVEEVEPDAGRLTKDIDIVVRRADLERIKQAVEPFGLQYRHVAGVDMLMRRGSHRRAGQFTWFSPERRFTGLPGADSGTRDLSHHQGNPARPSRRFGPHETHQLSCQGRSAPQGSRRSRSHHCGTRDRTLTHPAREAGTGSRHGRSGIGQRFRSF